MKVATVYPRHPILGEQEEELYQRFDRWYPDHIPSYDELINGMGGRVSEWLLGTPGYSMRDAIATAHALYGRYVWRRAGCPIYELRPLIFQALCETELPEDFLVDEVKTPYEGMLIALPRDVFLEVADLRPEAIYVTNVPAEPHIRIVAHSHSQQLTQHTKLPIIPGATIEQAIATATEDMFGIATLVTPRREDLRVYYQDSPVFCFVVNLLLYLSCSEADILQDKTKVHEIHAKLQGLKKGRRREELEKQLSAAKQASKTYIIGAAYKEPAVETEKHSSDKRWTLQKRIRVPGFWRWQAHGPKHSLRRRQFIPPHWRGPTFAEQVERNFVVSDRTQMQKEIHESFRDDLVRTANTPGSLPAAGPPVPIPGEGSPGPAGQGHGESGEEVQERGDL